MITELQPPTFPARPFNGGPLGLTKSKGGYTDPEAWAFEPKVDGRRLTVHVPTGLMWNRQGQPASGLSHSDFEPALKQVMASPFEWLDIEELERRANGIAAGCFVVLDWMVRDVPYSERRKILKAVFPPFVVGEEPEMHHSARLIESSWVTDTNTLIARNEVLGCTFYEGWVAKKRDAAYPFQTVDEERECHCWIKHRFTTQ